MWNTTCYIKERPSSTYSFIVASPPNQIGIFKFVPNIESERPSPPEIWSLGDPRRRGPHRFVIYIVAIPWNWNLEPGIEIGDTLITMSDLPSLSSLPQQPQETQLRVLDTLFEPSPELHQLMIPVLAGQSFSSYASLIDAVGGRMSALSAVNSPTDRNVLFGILGSHPRLGHAPANPEHLSELSKKEQAQLNEGAEEQAEKLRELNAEYEAKFPGLRFV